MEHNEKLANVEELTTLIQSFSKFIKDQENDDDALKRIEAKVDIVAQSDPATVIDFSIAELKEYIEDLTEKLSVSSDEMDVEKIVEQLKGEISKFEKYVKSSNSEVLSNLDSRFVFINEKFNEIFELINQKPAGQLSTISIDSHHPEISVVKDKLSNIFEVLSTMQIGLTADRENVSSLYDEIKALEVKISEGIKSLKINVDNELAESTQEVNEETIEAVKAEIQNLHKQLVNQFLHVYNDISFEKEKEDLNISIGNIEKNLKHEFMLLETKVDRIHDVQGNGQAGGINQESIDSIKTEIQNLGKQLVNQFIQVYNSISFEKEKEDLNDAIESIEKSLRHELVLLTAKVDRIHDVQGNGQPGGINQESIDSIKTEIQNLSKHLINQFIQIYNSISFEKEKDDLKYAVESIEKSLKHEFMLLEAKFDRIHKNVEEDTISTLEKNVELLRSDISSLLEKMHGGDGSKTDEIYDEVKFISTNLSDKFNELKTALCGEIGDAENSDALNGRVVKELENIKGEFYSYQNKVAQLNVDFEGLEENFSSNVSDKVTEKIEKVSSLIENFDESLSAKISEEIAKINESVEGLKNIEQNVSDLLDNVELIEKVNEIREHLGSIDVHYGNSKEDFDNLITIVNKAREDFNALDSKIESIMSKSEENTEAIENTFIPLFNESKQAIRSLEEKLETMISRSESSTEEFESVFSNLFNQTTGSIKALDDKLEALLSVSNTGLDDFENKIALIKDLSEKTNFNMGNIVEKIINIDSEVTVLKENIENNDSSDITADIINSNFHNFGLELQNAFDKLNAIKENIENNDSSDITADIINNNFHNLRLELQNTFDKLNAINEDVSDISARTNKLILTSNDGSNLLNASSDILKDQLGTFKQLIDSIKEDTEHKLFNIQKVVDAGIDIPISEIDNKVADIKDSLSIMEHNQNTVVKGQDVLVKNVNRLYDSSETVKDCLVQIAEWVDNAGDLIERTNDNVNEVRRTQANTQDVIVETASRNYDNIKELLNLINDKVETTSDQLEEVADRKNKLFSGITDEISGITESFAEFESKIKDDLKELVNSNVLNDLEVSMEHMRRDSNRELKKINDKFYTMEAKLEAIEDKLDKALAKSPLHYDDDETRQILEFIAGQVTAASEGSRGLGLVFKRVDSVEKQISGFDLILRKILDKIEDR